MDIMFNKNINIINKNDETLIVIKVCKRPAGGRFHDSILSFAIAMECLDWNVECFKIQGMRYPFQKKPLYRQLW